jgi:hypothetical protein
MRNLFLTLATLLIAGAFLSLSAQNHKFSLDIRGGANLSDLNYGYELFDFENFFPRNDYIFFGEGGQGDYGLHVGIGASARVFKRFLLFGGVDYARLRYGVDASVDSLRPSVSRPLSPNLPIMADGVVGYSFINARTGLSYSFNKNVAKGLALSVSLSNMIHLDTDWTLDITYETLRMGTEEELPPVAEPDYQHLWFLNLGLDYKFLLGEKISLVPYIEYNHGLNPLVTGALNPQAFNAGIGLKWWL